MLGGFRSIFVYKLFLHETHFDSFRLLSSYGGNRHEKSRDTLKTIGCGHKLKNAQLCYS